MTTTLAIMILLVLTASAAAGTRTLQTRIGWLEQRVKVHSFGCTHPQVRRHVWHCAAQKWTLRELRQAQAELYRRDWLTVPEPYLSIARCEQRGNGPLGVTWDAYSESYEGGFGFTHQTWDQFRLPGMPDNAARATARQQTRVAERLHAYFGNYTPWPACHIRLGLR